MSGEAGNRPGPITALYPHWCAGRIGSRQAQEEKHRSVLRQSSITLAAKWEMLEKLVCMAVVRHRMRCTEKPACTVFCGRQYWFFSFEPIHSIFNWYFYCWKTQQIVLNWSIGGFFFIFFNKIWRIKKWEHVRRRERAGEFQEQMRELDGILWLPVTSGLWRASHAPRGPRKYRNGSTISRRKGNRQTGLERCSGLEPALHWQKPKFGVRKGSFYCTHVSSACRAGLQLPARWREERRAGWGRRRFRKAKRSKAAPSSAGCGKQRAGTGVPETPAEPSSPPPGPDRERALTSPYKGGALINFGVWLDLLPSRPLRGNKPKLHLRSSPYRT